jgi:hypothetical protein
MAQLKNLVDRLSLLAKLPSYEYAVAAQLAFLAIMPAKSGYRQLASRHVLREVALL